MSAAADREQTLRQAIACHETGRLREAERLYRQLLTEDPADADALQLLGLLASQLGHPEDGGRLIEESLRIRPGHSGALMNLGVVRAQLGRTAEARACLEEALRLSPGNSNILSNLGGLLAQMGDVAAAEAHYRMAVAGNPESPQYRISLGNTLEQLGRAADAVEQYREVIRLQPDSALAYLRLSTLARNGHGEFTDHDVDSVRGLLAHVELPDDDRYLLNFALGSALEQRRRHEEAFEYYRRGNEVRRANLSREGRGFDRERHRRSIDRLTEICSGDYFARVTGFGNPSRLPIFIVGMPRSGTSLVEQILASHPRVVGTGESREIPTALGTVCSRARAPYPDCLQFLDAELSRQLAGVYVDRLRLLAGTAERVTDKLPENHLYIGFIATLLPGAHFIHCRRDPRDVCVSCFTQAFANDAYAFTLDLDDLAFFHRQCERLMEHWRRVLPGRILDVCYEELVADPEPVCRRMLAHCELDWDPRCLNFHANSRAVQTPSALQVRKPVYTNSIGRWRRYGEQIRPLLDAFGDGPVAGPAARGSGADPAPL